MSSTKSANDKLLIMKQRVIEVIPNCKVMSGVEYKDLFVFVVEPMMLGLIAVSKRDGKVFGFNPMLNDPDSYFEIAEKNMVDLE